MAWIKGQANWTREISPLNLCPRPAALSVWRLLSGSSLRDSWSPSCGCGRSSRPHTWQSHFTEMNWACAGLVNSHHLGHFWEAIIRVKPGTFGLAAGSVVKVLEQTWRSEFRFPRNMQTCWVGEVACLKFTPQRGEKGVSGPTSCCCQALGLVERTYFNKEGRNGGYFLIWALGLHIHVCVHSTSYPTQKLRKSTEQGSLWLRLALLYSLFLPESVKALCLVHWAPTGCKHELGLA